MASPSKVLIVDDSAVMRRLLTDLVQRNSDLQVVGAAADGLQALEMVQRLQPDVVTMDVAMPGMDGLACLEKMMQVRPTPVVMVSALTQRASDTTLRAMELGAVDFIGKPVRDGQGGFVEYARELGEKIQTACSARIGRLDTLSPDVSITASPVPSVSHRPLRGAARPVVAPTQAVAAPAALSFSDKIIFIGASTGGTEAVRHVLQGLPADCPPVLIVQHMPETFTHSFARRLDSACAPHVIESQGGELVQPGTVYIAPGHSHLLIKRTARGLETVLSSAEPVNRHRPSVDVLFQAAAEVVGRRAVGVILTGMGKDGAVGLLNMRRAGAATIGQDESSCVVYGMPREAAVIGAVEEVAPLKEVAHKILQAASR